MNERRPSLNNFNSRGVYSGAKIRDNESRDFFLKGPEYQTMKKLKPISERDYRLSQMIKDFSKSRLARILAVIGIGSGVAHEFGVTTIKSEKISNEAIYHKDMEATGFAEEKKEIEALKNMRQILEQESIGKLYEGTNQAEEFRHLVEQEEEKILKMYGNDLERLEKAYGKGIANLFYLFEVAKSLGVPRGIIMGVALEESGFNKNAKNKKSSAKSEMQIINETAKNWQAAFAKLLDKWIGDFKKTSYEINSGKEDVEKLRELRQKIALGKDLRIEDGLYLGAFGFRKLCYDRGSEDSALLAYKIGNEGARQEIALARKKGLAGTYLDIRPNLKNEEDRQYIARVQAELNVFLQVLDQLTERVEAQSNQAFNGQSIFYNPDDKKI